VGGRRRGSVSATLILAATFSSADLPGEILAAAPTASIDRDVNALPLGTDTTHELRTTPVAAGAEGLELSARLTAEGGLIQRPVSWTLHRLGGERVFDGSMPTASLALEPGDYLIEATYGSAHVAQAVNLEPRERIGLTFVLNVGGVRILPRVADFANLSLHPISAVYATSGPDQGKLITLSDYPGEVLRLPAGSYRIESRYAAGNAEAVAEVIIKPGLLSSIEISHRAGIAHLAGPPDAVWSLTDEKGRSVPLGQASEVVLVPGRYIARAKTGGGERTISFSAVAGSRINVIAR
jgi:hypothetical protein